MPKYIDKPFAVSGDKTPIPDDATGGAVNYEEGYTPDYQLAKTDPARRNIDRAPMNQLFNDITENIKQWQDKLYPEFSADKTGGYKQGDIVELAGVFYKSNIDSNSVAPPSAGWGAYSIAGAGDGKYLTTNFNFSVATPDPLITPPDATPRNYNAGNQIFFNWFVATGGAVGITYNNGVANTTTSGVIYQDVAKTGALQYAGAVTGSQASTDLIGSETGVTVTDEGASWRISIDLAVASNVMSGKLENGPFITGHVALNASSALKSASRYIVSEILNINAGYQLYNDGYKRQWGSVVAAGGALAKIPITPLLPFTTEIHKHSASGFDNGDLAKSTTGSTKASPATIEGWSGSASGTISFYWAAEGY